MIAQALADLGAEVLYYPTVATVYGRWPSGGNVPLAALAALRGSCEASGGALVVEAAPLDLKARLGVWGSPRADFALMRRLKEQLDPASLLSPGRFLGGI